MYKKMKDQTLEETLHGVSISIINIIISSKISIIFSYLD